MKKFDEMYREALEDIDKRAQALGLQSYEVFEGVGFSAATLYRWQKNLPRTVRMVVQLQEEIERLEAQKGLRGGAR